MSRERQQFDLPTEPASTPVDQLLDRDGNPVAGVGRLDQVIGAEAADEFFTELEERRRYLHTRALKRWGPGGHGYGRLPLRSLLRR